MYQGLTVCPASGTVLHMGHTATRKSVAETIIQGLAARDLSQRHLARATGISLGKINRALNQERDFTIPELGCIAVVLGLKPSELVERAEVA